MKVILKNTTLEFQKQRSPLSYELDYSATSGTGLNQNSNKQEVSVPQGMNFDLKIEDPSNCLATNYRVQIFAFYSDDTNESIAQQNGSDLGIALTARKDISYFGLYGSAANIVNTGVITLDVDEVIPNT